MSTVYARSGQLSPLHVKDPGSASTHFVGALLAAAGTLPLIHRSLHANDPVNTVSMTIFMVSMILLYSASTIYHSLDISPKVNKLLKKMDHLMIFVLIAGSYTPICLIPLRNGIGPLMCALVWGTAIVGMIIKALWIYCPKWFSSVIYIGMGWICLMGFPELLRTLAPGAFLWLLIGGIIYTIGGVIYALKLPIFNSRHKNFGSHEIFHLFVMAGSLCHYIVMYAYLAR